MLGHEAYPCLDEHDYQMGERKASFEEVATKNAG
jgi:hypothetical protein